MLTSARGRATSPASRCTRGTGSSVLSRPGPCPRPYPCPCPCPCQTMSAGRVSVCQEGGGAYDTPCVATALRMVLSLSPSNELPMAAARPDRGMDCREHAVSGPRGQSRLAPGSHPLLVRGTTHLHVLVDESALALHLAPVLFKLEHGRGWLRRKPPALHGQPRRSRLRVGTRHWQSRLSVQPRGSRLRVGTWQSGLSVRSRRHSGLDNRPRRCRLSVGTGRRRLSVGTGRRGSRESEGSRLQGKEILGHVRVPRLQGGRGLQVCVCGASRASVSGMRSSTQPRPGATDLGAHRPGGPDVFAPSHVARAPWRSLARGGGPRCSRPRPRYTCRGQHLEVRT